MESGQGWAFEIENEINRMMFLRERCRLVVNWQLCCIDWIKELIRNLELMPFDPQMQHPLSASLFCLYVSNEHLHFGLYFQRIWALEEFYCRDVSFLRIIAVLCGWFISGRLIPMISIVLACFYCGERISVCDCNPDVVGCCFLFDHSFAVLVPYWAKMIVWPS